ncbi:hypothetical protein ACFL4D_02625 [Candidatus Margulisiibacteriota bacterium]
MVDIIYPEEQKRKLLALVDKIRNTCPMQAKSNVIPLLDKIIKAQQKLDKVNKELVETSLVAREKDELAQKEERIQQLHEEHKALTTAISKALEKVLSYVQG